LAKLNLGSTIGCLLSNWICLSTGFLVRADCGVFSDLPDFCDFAGEGVFLVYGATRLCLRGDLSSCLFGLDDLTGDFVGDEFGVFEGFGLLNLAARALTLLPRGLTEVLSAALPIG
jgi:hypothetical protein